MSTIVGSRWNKARNRDRNEARYKIRQKLSSSLVDESLCKDKKYPTNTSSNDDDVNNKLVKYFNSVSNGSASSFSLKVISDDFNLLSSTHDSAFMSEYKIKTLCKSRFGQEYANAMLLYKKRISHCSLIEYAALIGEFGVVCSLISGGICNNPFKTTDDDNLLRGIRKQKVSKSAVQKLVLDLIPSSLAAYVIKCLFQMKMWSIAQGNELCEDIEKCPLCFETTMNQKPLYRFDGCGHKCCELCMWEYTLENINKRTEGNVVICPICLDGHENNEEEILESDTQDILVTPDERREKSLKMFKAIPKDVKELKQSSKRKVKSKNMIHSSWNSALIPCIGRSQDVRRDKFFRYVECGALHHCQACLKAGVDVNALNEYNQTPFYIACWRNHIDLVKLLLEWGADPFYIHANGKMSAFNVVTENMFREITLLLQNHSGNIDKSVSTLRNRIIDCIQSNNTENEVNATFETLISQESEHPGAGSFIIDNSVSEGILQFLEDLFSILPIAPDTKNVKKKSNLIPCSDRHYFCDAEGYFHNVLAGRIESILKSDGCSRVNKVQVFPHMRFLNYTKPGSILAPHVDLFKKDPLTGKRSTHTFILYLRGCERGGETVLLNEISDQNEVIAKVNPRRGRLLLFPHLCPHAGKEVISTPKLLLRGEVCLE